MPRRVLVLDLVPGPPLVPRIAPMLILPLPDGRAAVPLGDLTAEEALAALLAEGLGIRSSRVIEE